MLTVIMECRDQEAELAQTLSVLVAGAVEGLVSDVVVLDHGSKDGSSDVADAAGCRFHLHWDLAEIVRGARGEWLLLLEPGARPQSGWVEEIAEYMALNRLPARFSPSVSYRLPLLKRIFRAVPPLEPGFLISKSQVLAAAKPGLSLAELAKGQKTRRLASELIPSWVARSLR
ncbi:glycosyl transferase [Rhizobium sp. LjRoot30]|uniref:glycosyl transferase n=1 Tax=Rhizobium sp. LjRoot30 TaxID=3342320 RepID=UPI003ECEFB53